MNPLKFEACEEVNKPFAHSSIESANSIKSDISFSLDNLSNLDITLDDLGCSDGDMHDFCTGDTKKNNWGTPDVWIEDYSTTDSSMPAPPKQYEISKYNAKGSREKFKLDYFLFKKDEGVPYVPHDINGMHKYIIHCTELEWKSKQNDGRYWKTTCGKNQNLNGFHRVSKCHGSLQCTNEKCPKVQCNLGQNKSSFERCMACDRRISTSLGVKLRSWGHSTSRPVYSGCPDLVETFLGCVPGITTPITICNVNKS